MKEGMNESMNGDRVVAFFKEVSAIPRVSGDEQAISEYLMDFAKERGLEAKRDAVNNVIIKKPASVENPGEPVILQGHTDMVYVKDEGSSHKYEEGIQVQEDGTYFFANGTSLGADNGIALAYCLALLDSKELAHPDLEVIFTAQEEVGLAGANAIDISDLKGTRFINIDSEEEGIFCVSCAGGVRCRLGWEAKKETPVEGDAMLRVHFKGMEGGHSGMNISSEGANSIVLLGRVLYELKDIPVAVCELKLPGQANAIANSGCFGIVPKADQLEVVKERLKELEAVFKAEYAETDSVSLEVEEVPVPEGTKAFASELIKRVTEALVLLPFGVARFSHAMEGLVETSMNLGALTEEEDRLSLLLFIRSSVETQKQMMRAKIEVIADAFCDTCKFENDYPGWKYRKDSPLRDRAIEVYEKMFQKPAKTEAIHAGLECGYWDYKKKGLDMISIGPDLYDVHSIKERVSKQSIENVWQFLIVLLEELARKM